MLIFGRGERLDSEHFVDVGRKLRIQFEGAIYHVINRGNYRRDVFESAGTAKAFETTLDECCERHRWRLHAYVIMRNHYHLAVETPQANLVGGMHWLQSTFATRFNRLRSENGHLFQGRYQSLLIEDATALARVVDYIHLNPVVARIVPVEQVGAFRWSSLARFLKGARPSWLMAKDWLEALGLTDDPAGWSLYGNRLRAQAEVSTGGEDDGAADELTRGFAIGTRGWRQALAREHAALALEPGLSAEQMREVREARWSAELNAILQKEQKTHHELQAAPKGADWKIAAAERLRLETGAPHRWIAKHLAMGSPNSVRSYLSRRRREVS